ncbi:MAG: hypothetical protein LBK99_20235 [Opitutaceae bacterium]|nr:hypothetical protein [Opitutaceae bacterium]
MMPAAFAKLRNASSAPLSAASAGLPFVGGAMQGWFQPITAGIITKTIADFEAKEAVAEIAFQGVRQPLSPRELMLKPEGERAWRWEMLHCDPSLTLNPDDIVIFKGTRYRVRLDASYPEYGYNMYHIVEDTGQFDAAPAPPEGEGTP